MRRILSALLLASAALAQTPSDPHALARDILSELISINTTDTPQGSVTKAAEAMRKRFLDAGFPAADLQLLGPEDRPEKQNLVVRYRGTGARRPMLILCHLDVVQALPKDWTSNPFQLIEREGYLYGRGTQDMKGSDAIVVANLIRLHRENFKPSRDIILILTADEEGGSANGPEWLLRTHRDLLNAEFGLNPDGGGPVLKHGKPFIMELTASEKAYADYTLTATHPGGHSSIPVPDNPIYHVADALVKVQNYRFPIEVDNVTRLELERMAQLESGQLAADLHAIAQNPHDEAAGARLSQNPEINSKLRTTCVATMAQAGHALNALPQTATANINCRIFPGHTRAEIMQQLTNLFADPKLKVSYDRSNGDTGPVALDKGSAPPPPIPPDFLKSLEASTAKFFPGAIVVPAMDAGASDDIYTNAAGIPSYEVSATPVDQDDVRAHGKDERIRIADFNNGVDFYYDFLQRLTR